MVDLIFRLAVERILACQHAEGDDTDRPYVHLIVVGLLADYLGCHIQRCPKRQTQTLALTETCKSEISHLAGHGRYLALLSHVHHNVLQL